MNYPLLQALIPRKFFSAAIKSNRITIGLQYFFQGMIEAPATPAPKNVLEFTPRDNDDFRQMSFTFAVIALCAQVARADGALTREKYVAFRDAFPLSGGICGKIRGLFSMACNNTAPFDSYVTQIKYTYPRNLPLFSALLERLFSVAAADGAISRNEERMLGKIAHMLEITPAEYSRIRDQHQRPMKPHQVLGVDKRVRLAPLKKRYRELMWRYHPDRYAADKVSPEVELLLQLKVSEINKAYRFLSKKAA